MPPRPSWFARIDAIHDDISSLAVPMLDRAAIEKAFRIGRRQAIRLMADLPGHRAGRTVMVFRDDLLAWLRSHRDGQNGAGEIARKIQFADAFVSMYRAARPRLIQLKQAESSRDDRLPEGVSITTDGEHHRVLHIQYDSPKDLIGRFLMLTEAANNDYARFCEMVEDDRQ